MPQVSPTRSELLARRAQIALANQGHSLLDGKRGALLREFHRLGTEGLRRMDTLDERAVRASHALARARAVDGPEALVSAALAAGGESGLSDADRRALEFGDTLERRFVDQGAGRRTIEETPDLAWELMEAFPADELRRLDPELVEARRR